MVGVIRRHWKVWAVLGLAMSVCLLELVMRGMTGDFYWDVAAGRWMLAHGQVLTVNLWGWTSVGRTWINNEWLFGVLVAWLASWGRSYAEVGMVCVGIVSYFTGLWVLSGEWRVSLGGRVVVIAVGALGSWMWWDYRPQVLAYGMAVWAFVVMSRWARAMRGDVFDYAAWWRRRWPEGLAFVVGVGVWSQIHGSWVLVPLWAGVEWALSSRVARSWWVAIFVGSVVAASANPWGFGGVLHTVYVSSSSVIATFIAEWVSPNWHDPLLALLYGFYLVGLVPVMVRYPRVVSWVYWAGFLVAAMWAIRFMPYMAIGVAVVLSEVPVRVPRWGHWWGPVVAGVLAVAVLGSVGMVYRGGRLVGGPQVSRTWEPVGAVKWLQSQKGLGGVRLFAMYRWGGYLELAGYQPWIDGRADYWTSVGTQFQRYMMARAGMADPLELVRSTGARLAMVQVGSTFAWSLREAGWRVLYRGPLAWVLERPS